MPYLVQRFVQLCLPACKPCRERCVAGSALNVVMVVNKLSQGDHHIYKKHWK